jgi:hypothetical protein
MKRPRIWRRCKLGLIRRVDFALGSDVVRLLSTFVYQRSAVQSGGRVYQVESLATGRQDIVGVEYLRKLEK